MAYDVIQRKFSMKTISQIIAICSAFFLPNIQAQLITDKGTHSFPKHAVIIKITGVEPDNLKFTMEFDSPSSKYASSKYAISTGDSMKWAAEKWAAQFVAPNELWIFDGFGRVSLYERIGTFSSKVSDSDSNRQLLVKAPKELKAIIAPFNSTVSRRQEMKKDNKAEMATPRKPSD